MQLAPSPLLALPDPCLVAVMQCCAASDMHSLFSAARPHSRLHQAAALAPLRCIDADLTWFLNLQQKPAFLQYVGHPDHHINTLKLKGSTATMQEATASLCELPPYLQLRSLELGGMRLQLQPGQGFQGLLGAAAHVADLKRLELRDCIEVFDGSAEGLTAALYLLPIGLEHLSINGLYGGHFPVGVLQRLQALTSLKLVAILLQGPDRASPSLQPLQALTRLIELRN